jgi:hypothetical protein
MPLAIAVRLLPTPDTGTSPRGHGRRAGRAGNGHQSGQGLDAAIRGLHPASPPAARPARPPRRAPGPAVAWGPYEAAIRRWEHILGCPAPAPAETGPGQQARLSAAFTEWIMGIPGWVTAIPGIPRTALLRILGNGVVPQQAAAAMRLLIATAAAAGSGPDRQQPAPAQAGPPCCGPPLPPRPPRPGGSPGPDDPPAPPRSQALPPA